MGTTIFTEMSALANEYKAMNLAQGFPDFEIDQDLKTYLADALTKGYNQYAPMAGLPKLTEAIALDIRNRHSTEINSASEITITPGATYGIYTALATLVRPMDEVIILEPAYDSYAPNVQSLGGKVIGVPRDLQNFSVDWQKVKDAVTVKTKVIIVNSPHNPSGAVWTNEDLVHLKKIVRDTNIFIISDEVYEYLVFDEKRHFSLVADEELFARSFIIFSFGKVLQATGWKIGYTIAPEPLMKEFRKMHQYIGFSVNSPCQYAIAEYLSKPNTLGELSKTFQARRDFFLSQFATLPFSVPFQSQGSYFQVLSFNGLSTMTDKEYALYLTKKAGVATIPLSSFYCKPTQTGMLRFCFAKHEKTLMEASQRLSVFFK